MQNSTARLLCCVHCTVGVSSEFDADFESVTEISKKHAKKVTKKRQKNGFFDFCCSVAKFLASKFFWTHLTDSNLASNFGPYESQIEFFRQKKRKRIFYIFGKNTAFTCFCFANKEML